VDYYTIGEEPWLRDFGTRLRWFNLWWPASFPGDDTAGEDTSRRKLTSSSTCDWEETGSFVSVGNLTLLVGILFCIFFLHLLVISGLEAYWLLEKRSKAEWEAARSRGTTDSEIRARLSGKHVRHRVLPLAEDDAKVGTSLSPS
ncbi:unnamed protein product, partial [Ascophyllum nodosum]